MSSDLIDWAAKAQDRLAQWKKLAGEGANRITQTEQFQEIIRTAFKESDYDGNGFIDEKEVYCAILLFYCKLIRYVSAATPPPKEYVKALYQQLGKEGDSKISFDEFRTLCMVLASELAARTTVEAIFTFAIGPLFASLLLLLAAPLFPEAPDKMPDWMASLMYSTFSSMVTTVVVILLVPRVLEPCEAYFYRRRTDVVSKFSGKEEPKWYSIMRFRF